MLKKLIKTVTGREANCQITLQHRLDHWCARIAKLPFARHTVADGETVWTCAAGSDLNLGETARACVDDAGSCTQCRGVLLTDSVSPKYDKALQVSRRWGVVTEEGVERFGIRRRKITPPDTASQRMVHCSCSI